VEQFFSRFWENLISRPGGPMAFRFMLQPTIVAILAIRDGLKDAREGRPPYSWAVFTDPANRRRLLWDGWKTVAKVFVVSIILDFIYQIIVHQWLYLLEALIVASILSLFPYLLIRGPVNRIARRRYRRTGEPR
jgi:hypothetical protein